jgi:outer membrane protein W
MRRAALAFALCLAAAPVLGQPSSPHPGALRFTLFGSSYGSGYSSNDGFFGDGALGAALEYRFSPRLGVELSLSGARHVVGFVRANQFFEESVTTYPLDFMGQYYFSTGGPWKPYLGLGVHYVDAPRSPVGPLEDRLSPQFSAGVEYLIGSRLSLTLDAKRLLRDRYLPYDPELKASVGFGWRF